MSPVLSLLQMRRGYVITPLIMYANIAMFLWLIMASGQVMWFPAQLLAEMGANYGPWTTQGEWWRLWSSIFLHGGLLHLLFNLLVLANIGIILEPWLGHVRFAVLYVLAGGIASWTSLTVNINVVSVGASGAVFGLYGFFLALLLCNRLGPSARQRYLGGTAVFIGINLVLGFTVPVVDNAAHLGGLIAGFVFGLLPSSRRRGH